MSLLRPWVGEENVHEIDGCRRQLLLQYFNGVVTNHAQIAERRGFCAEQQPSDPGTVHLDADAALAAARALDRIPDRGLMHGLPVGIKDVVDTSDQPTRYGSPIHANHRPGADAGAVAMLRAAGGLVAGKTVTTELAVYAPNKTRNPHDPGRTPGGSSSGSAAAVAAGMVPLAIGTQTNGSVIRPASFCGVFGYKPSHGLISRHGILEQSPPLDTAGVMAADLDDLALLAGALMAFDAADPAMRPHPGPDFAG